MNDRRLVDQYLTCEIAWILQNHCRRVTWGRRQGRGFAAACLGYRLKMDVPWRRTMLRFKTIVLTKSLLSFCDIQGGPMTNRTVFIAPHYVVL